MYCFLDDGGTIWQLDLNHIAATPVRLATVPGVNVFISTHIVRLPVFLGTVGSCLVSISNGTTIDFGEINPVHSANPFPGIAISQSGSIWVCGNDGLFEIGATPPRPKTDGGITTDLPMTQFDNHLLIANGVQGLHVYKVMPGGTASLLRTIHPSDFSGMNDPTRNLQASCSLVRSDTDNVGNSVVRIAWTSRQAVAGLYIGHVTTCRWRDIISIAGNPIISYQPILIVEGQQINSLAELDNDAVLLGLYPRLSIETHRFAGGNWSKSPNLPALNGVVGHIKCLQKL